jgi:hypothetical protein
MFQAPGHLFSKMTATWIVPDAPTGSYDANTVYYTFPGLEDTTVVPTYILQPVLQYGKGQDNGGAYWTIVSWRCSASGPCTHSSVLRVNTGDVLLGSVTATSCASGRCTWTTTTWDVTANVSTTLSQIDTAAYTWATGGAVEEYNLSACNQYPMDGVSLYGITLYNENNVQVTPSWSPNYQSGPSPSCGFLITSTATTVKLNHNITTVISGPTAPNTGVTSTWSASGIGPDAHTFQWYRNDTLLSGKTSASFTYRPLYPNPFKLGLTTHNSKTGWNDSLTLNVVASETLTLNGPIHINTPGGTCSWSASNQGGVYPLTYLWTWDGVNVGTASSYVGEALGNAGDHHSLSVLVTDSVGTPRSIVQTVNFVASGGMMCLP